MQLKEAPLDPAGLFTPWPAAFAERYRSLGYWRGETLGGMLRQSAARNASKLALVGGGRRVSYGELDRRADELCAAFRRLGIARGDRVVVQLSNAPEFVEVCFGLFRLGALPVLALPAHRHSELEAFMRSSEATAYICDDPSGGFDFPALGRRLLTEVSSLKQVIVAGEAAEFVSLASLAGERRLEVEPAASSIALLQLSGGSTAIPKLIARTHDDYLYSVRRSAEVCRLDECTVYLCALPVAHNFPLSSPGVLGVLYAGGTVVFAARPSPDSAFPLIESERVTITALVPPLVALWLEAAKKRGAQLRSLQVLQVGGAKLGYELAKRIRPELGCALQQVYGMAEGLVNYTRLDDEEDVVLRSQGRPMCPDDELRLLDVEGRPVPEGSTGELWTRGPYTIRGYYGAGESGARSFDSDGFYCTGDVVRLLPSGHLVVEGRSKELINRGGDKVSAEEVEEHLLAHPDVLDAVLVAVPDAFLGEQACAFVVARREGLAAKELLAFLRTREIASYKLPDRFRFVSEFPKTGVGKVSRKALREELARSAALEAAARKRCNPEPALR